MGRSKTIINQQKLIVDNGRIRPHRGRTNCMNGRENVYCLLDLVFRLHYTCVPWFGSGFLPIKRVKRDSPGMKPLIF